MVKENDDQMKLIKENLEHEMYAKEYLLTLVHPDRNPPTFNALIPAPVCFDPNRHPRLWRKRLGARS